MKITVIGYGGHAKSCLDIIEMLDHEVIDIVVTPNQMLDFNKYVKYLISKCENIVVGIGQMPQGSSREILFNTFKEAGAKFPVLISPLAYVSSDVQIGEGTIIMHHALVNTNSKIGSNCIINSKALIEHDCKVGDNCHISTGAILNGTVTVGNKCFIGSGSVLKNNISIGDDVIIGAGNRIMNNIGAR